LTERRDLGCHPGLDDDLPTIYYYRERGNEAETPCDAEIAATTQHLNTRLISYSDPVLSTKV
jgi:hypothetical protein